MQVRRFVNVLAVGILAIGTTTACATKKFVRTEVQAVGQRVETLSQSLESTQEQTRQNSAQIKQVDAKADQVGIWAKEAQTSASTANSAAAAASARADAIDVASKRLVYEVVISEDQGGFKFASAQLPEAVQSRIDQMIADLKANPWASVEISHTDWQDGYQPAHW
jgi:outer membrane protein OmpA-like peptidoglycan-associated protein